MRKPSIHIDIDTFTYIVNRLGKIDINNIEEFFVIARKHSINNRSVTISNDKLKRDIQRVVQSSKGDTSLMADIIYSVRIKLKHRGVKRITLKDREWLQLKELTKLVNQFCNDFNLSTREGFIEYVELGLSKIQSFRGYITKLINMYESICREFESIKIIKEDDDPKATKELHDCFVSKVADRTGLYESYDGKPDKMVLFYKARVMCDELGVDYDTFIDSQFEALDWCNGMPVPESLIGDKAKERLNKYLFRNKISVQTKSKKDFWKSLKQR